MAKTNNWNYTLRRKTAVNKSMLLKFAEQNIRDFLIPEFSISAGELIVIQFPNSSLSWPAWHELIDLLTDKVINDRVEIKASFMYANHIRRIKKIGSFFRPLTVGRYLRSHANENHPIIKQIYDSAWIRPETKVVELAGNTSRKLAVCAVLSLTNRIVFDLTGVDPQGVQEIGNIVNAEVSAGGAAILLSYTERLDINNTNTIYALYQGKPAMLQLLEENSFDVSKYKRAE